MAFILTIRDSDEDESGYPVLATADPEIIDIVVRGLARKLNCDLSPLQRRLSAARKPVDKDRIK